MRGTKQVRDRGAPPPGAPTTERETEPASPIVCQLRVDAVPSTEDVLVVQAVDGDHPPAVVTAHVQDGPRPAAGGGGWRRGLPLRVVVALLGVVVVLAVILLYGLFRHNRFAGASALLLGHVALLATVFLRPFSPLSAASAEHKRLLVRVAGGCYVVGVVAGVLVATDSSNVIPRWTAIIVLLGLHAVLVAAVATLVEHRLDRFSTLHRRQLITTAIIGVVAGALVAMVSVRRVHRTLGLSTGAYLLLILAVAVVVVLTQRFMRDDPSGQPTSLHVMVGFTSFVLGAVGIVASVVLMAFWRNNDPVAGPPIHELPLIPAIDGVYVALGDSYSAGEGLQPFQPFTDSNPDRRGDGCHRSRLAYSQLLRFADPVPASRFVACSGAVISDVFDAHDDDGLRVGPQVPPGVHEEVGLVTITIGGNDAVFSRVVRHCFLHTHCLGETFAPPTPEELERNLILPGPRPLAEWAEAVMFGERADDPNDIESKVRAVYGRLRASYPNAGSS